ncbi:MAG: hypothetical protein WCO06_02930 [Candidatus Roizmanbacteria bacterium]
MSDEILTEEYKVDKGIHIEPSDMEHPDHSDLELTLEVQKAEQIAIEKNTDEAFRNSETGAPGQQIPNLQNIVSNVPKIIPATPLDIDTQ